MDNPDKPVT